MKKLVLSLAAVAMFASCSNEEVLEQAQVKNAEISFKSFVDKSTRAIDPSFNNTEKKPAFKVWGWMDGSEIFSAEEVDNTGDYGNDKRYWVADKQYEFVALAPQDYTAVSTVAAYLSDGTQKGQITVKDFSTNGTTDLIFATASPAVLTTLNTQPPAVSLTFQHMLSKVKFTFANGMTSNAYTIKVSNIKIKDAVAKGTLVATQSSSVWSNQTGDVELTFGNAVEADEETTNSLAIEIEQGQSGVSNNEMLMIPTTTARKYTLSFDVELLDVANNVIASKTDVAADFSIQLERGVSYNCTATLNENNLLGADTELYPITFTTTVGDWVPGTGDNATVQ